MPTSPPMSSIAVGNTNSTQLFKHVAGGKSRAVYQGKVTVAKGADGSDSRQTAKALLLGDAAEADLKPELEIFADDVKCAHGAAVGDLDADSLFYLRARGIPESRGPRPAAARLPGRRVGRHRPRRSARAGARRGQ